VSLKLEIKYTLLSIVILVIGLTPIANASRGLFTQISAPFLYGFASIARGLYNEWSFWGNLKNIQKFNYILEEKVATLSKQLTNQDTILRENELLKSDLKIKEQSPNYNLVLATIIGFSQGDEGIIVNTGSNLKVQVGSAVTYKDALVGIVATVMPNSAVIEPITSPQLKVASSITRIGASGVVSGDFGTQLKISGLLPGDPVVKGDIVSTSALNKNIPNGLVIGFVQDILTKPEAIQKEATLTMPFELASLEKLIIWNLL